MNHSALTCMSRFAVTFPNLKIVATLSQQLSWSSIIWSRARHAFRLVQLLELESTVRFVMGYANRVHFRYGFPENYLRS